MTIHVGKAAHAPSNTYSSDTNPLNPGKPIDAKAATMKIQAMPGIRSISRCNSSSIRVLVRV